MGYPFFVSYLDCRATHTCFSLNIILDNPSSFAGFFDFHEWTSTGNSMVLFLSGIPGYLKLKIIVQLIRINRSQKIIALKISQIFSILVINQSTSNCNSNIKSAVRRPIVLRMHKNLGNAVFLRVDIYSGPTNILIDFFPLNEVVVITHFHKIISTRQNIMLPRL